MERILEIKITVVVETNKNTYSETFDNIKAAQEFIETICDDL